MYLPMSHYRFTSFWWFNLKSRNFTCLNSMYIACDKNCQRFHRTPGVSHTNAMKELDKEFAKNRIITKSLSHVTVHTGLGFSHCLWDLISFFFQWCRYSTDHENSIDFFNLGLFAQCKCNSMLWIIGIFPICFHWMIFRQPISVIEIFW